MPFLVKEEKEGQMRALKWGQTTFFFMLQNFMLFYSLSFSSVWSAKIRWSNLRSIFTFFIEFLRFDKLYFVSSQFFFLKKFRWSKPQFSKNFQLFFEFRGKFSCSLILKANWHPKNGNEIYETGSLNKLAWPFVLYEW